MNRTKLLAKLHILLKQTGAEHHKEAIYASYNVASSRDMTESQLMQLIGVLAGDPAPAKQATPDEIRAMRSEVLFVLTANPDAIKPRRRGLGIPNDWQLLNPFISHHGGKCMKDMSYEELAAFKTQLCAMRSTGWRYRVKPAIPAPQPPVKEAPCPLIVIPLSKQGVVS